MNILKLLTSPEGKTLEFKRDLSSLKSVLKTLIAFANTAGGALIVGLDDDGTVLGVPEVLQAEERVASAIADSIRPVMMPEVEVYSHEGKPLLIMRVPHWHGPLQDIDIEKVQRIFKAPGRKINERKLESLGLIVPYAGRLVVSHGGLILFGLDVVRERYFPDARVSCARFRGTDKTEFIDRMDIEGSVLDAVELAPKFIRRNTRLSAKIENMQREDIP